MNILHTETLRKWGGQQNRVLSEAVGLAGRGHKVIIACNRGSMLAERARAAGLNVCEMDMNKSAYLPTIAALIRLIRREKIDVIATHSSVDSWAGGLAARLTGRRFVRFKHNLNRISRDPLSRFIYALPDLFITVNATSADILRASGFVETGKVVRVYGSIDGRRFDPAQISLAERDRVRASLGLPERACVIGNTSGFTDVKGQRFFLEAANRLFRQRLDLYLLLPGRLGVKHKVLDHVEARFHDRLILPGLRDDIPKMLSAMDVFVFPSITEAFGNALIEAMAMERPVAVSDIPSFREFMTEGVDGVFFRRADSDSLHSTLCHLLEREGQWRTLGAAARATVTGRFQFERMLDETEQAYVSLFEETRK